MIFVMNSVVFNDSLLTWILRSSGIEKISFGCKKSKAKTKGERGF